MTGRVLVSDPSIFEMGIARNPKFRLRDANCLSCFDVEVLCLKFPLSFICSILSFLSVKDFECRLNESMPQKEAVAFFDFPSVARIGAAVAKSVLKFIATIIETKIPL